MTLIVRSSSVPAYWKVAALFTLFLLHKARGVPIHLYGLNYNTRQGPDWDWNKCKSREQVLTDLTLLKRITGRIRLLSLTDCGQGEIVLSVAKQVELQVWLGLWVSEDSNVFGYEKETLERFLNEGIVQEDLVLGITVGSESIYRKEVTASEIILYKDQVKALVTSANVNIPISIVDIAPIYIQYPSLTKAVDVVMTNSFPFWENIPIENSVQDLFDDLTDILNQPQAQGKDIIIGETGWPSEGFLEGVGSASPELQNQYFREFYCRMDRQLNWKYYYFTSIDNAWRQEQDPLNTIEGNWGFLYANLTLKPHFVNLAFECDDGIEYSFAEIDWNIPLVTMAPAPLSPESCQANSGCGDLGLTGTCCPTPGGTYLGCCDNNLASSPTKSPLSAPPTINASPNLSPTMTMDTTYEPSFSSSSPVGADLPTQGSFPPTQKTAKPSTNIPTLSSTVTVSHFPTNSPMANLQTPAPTTATPTSYIPLPIDFPSSVSPTELGSQPSTEKATNAPSTYSDSPSKSALPTLPVSELPTSNPRPSSRAMHKSTSKAFIIAAVLTWMAWYGRLL